MNSSIKCVPPRLAASMSVSGIQHMIGFVTLLFYQHPCTFKAGTNKLKEERNSGMCWLRMWSDRSGSEQSGIFLYPLACDLSVFAAGVLGIAETLLCVLCQWCIWQLKDSNWETLAVRSASLLAFLLFLHNCYEISCCQNLIDHIVYTCLSWEASWITKELNRTFGRKDCWLTKGPL